MTEAPLQGYCVLVTRPSHQSAPLVEGIRNRGGEPFPFPTIEIDPLPEGPAWETVVSELDSFDWLVFVSRNAVSGVQHLLERYRAAWPARPRYAAIGAKTAQALADQGVGEVTTPAQFRSEGLLELPAMQTANVAGQRIALLRGERGRELLPETLEARGAKIVRLPVYRRSPPPQADPQQVSAALESGKLHAAVFTSPDTFTNLLAMLSRPAQELLRRVPAFVISPITGEVLIERGFPAPIVAPEASDEGILRGLSEWAVSRPLTLTGGS